MWELPARCRLPFPAPPTSLSLPNSHCTFHDVRIRGRLRNLTTACYPPVVLDLRIEEQGRIRGPGHVGVALVGVAVVLALAPLPVRCRERRLRSSSSWLSSRARSRRVRSRSSDRYQSRRGSSRSRRDRSRYRSRPLVA